MRAHLQAQESLRSKRDRDRYVQTEGALRVDIEQLPTSGFSPRSRRFPIETTIYYRKQGSSHWQQGRTLNISESGVLFGARQAPSPRTAVEMTFSLPVEGRIEAGAQVICHGEIVRNAPGAGSNDLQHVAATIVSYRLARSTTRREH
ncbi:MAG TPA: PilZ domain-containing protein [Terriglobia bacterium]|nr:PilZ domain-containing protein [Terriglobia bacterium]